MQDAAERLTAALHLTVPPIGITFLSSVPDRPPPHDGRIPAPADDGRTGRVPAGCVFWVHATASSFTTTAEDHANCSVGSLTHGFIDLDVAAARDDVAALVDAGWVGPDAFPSIPVVAARPAAIRYEPLGHATTLPDVVLIRTNPRGLMVITDAEPSTVIEGKPQCHIVALAKQTRAVAASVGCALSRARTGMPASELTCALPGARLEELVDSIERAAAVDATVARYAAADAARWQPVA